MVPERRVHRDAARRGRVGMTLDQVVPWGRSFDEYRRMFALADADLGGRVLGCGDGPASFNAEATARGHAVVSCDPVYAFTAAEIGRRVEETHATVVGQLAADPSGYVWEEFLDPGHLGECRLAAMRRFLADYEEGRAAGRYIAALLCRNPSSGRIPLMWHAYHPTDDEVRAGGGAPGPGGRGCRGAGVLVEVLQEDLHPAPAPRHPGRPAVPPGRLPGHRAAPPGLGRPARRDRPARRTGPLHHPEGRREAPGKKGWTRCSAPPSRPAPG